MWQRVKQAKGKPSTGETVSARKTGPSCGCFDYFSESEKIGLIKDFNKIRDKNLQDAHLFGLTVSEEVKKEATKANK